MCQEELERLRARVAVLEAGPPGAMLLDALLQSIPDFVYFKDRQRRFVRAGKAFEGLFARPLDEIIGRRDEDLFPPEVAAETSADDRRVIDGDSVVDRIEGGAVGPAGECWVSTTKIPWRDASGDVVGLLGISRDITQSKKRFDELQEEVMRSKRLELLGRLAGSIAHDFNNLLMVIFVAAQELSGRLQDDPDYLEDAKTIEEAVGSAQALIQQLSSYNRPKSFSQQPVDVNASIEGLEGTIKRMLPKDVTLELDLGEVDVPIWIDPSQFAQVVLNLAVNARDAMPRGGTLCIGSQVVEPEGEDAGRCVCVTIADTGTGMSEETKTRIFEPFYTTKVDGRGMGLGLATVMSVLKAGEREASIEVDSTLGEGTTFRISFPAVNALMPHRSSAPVAVDAVPLEGTVLVLDDQQAVRTAVGKMLRRCGLSVVEASDAREAVALVKEHRGQIDFLLSDVILRDETGPDVARMVHVEQPELPVVYMSGFSNHVFAQRGIEVDPGELLVKPFTEAMLRRRIQGLVRTARTPGSTPATGKLRTLAPSLVATPRGAW
ncbi:MAG: PAS domain-containing protein [Myxococcota bacterium]